MYPRDPGGQEKSSNQHIQQRCGSDLQRIEIWTGSMLPKCYRKSWPRETARKSNPGLGCSSELFIFLPPNVRADNA